MRIIASVTISALLSVTTIPALADQFEWGPLATQPRNDQNTIWDAHCNDSSEHVVSGKCTITSGTGTLQNVGVSDERDTWTCVWGWRARQALRADAVLLHSVNRSWTKESKVRILLQIAIDKDPALPDVPSIFDLAKTDEERQILTLWAAPNEMGRPYFAPPDVPPERLAILRRAFDAMEKDPEFRADAEESRLGADGISGEDVQALVRQVYGTPKNVVAKAAAAAKGK